MTIAARMPARKQQYATRTVQPTTHAPAKITSTSTLTNPLPLPSYLLPRPHPSRAGITARSVGHARLIQYHTFGQSWKTLSGEPVTGVDIEGDPATVVDTSPPPYPLPGGHAYGPTTGDLRYHNGRGSLTERSGLIAWQQRYRSAWWSGLDVTGTYDGGTQRAAVAVQKASGLPVTGMVDADTWRAVWAVQRPAKAVPEPVAEPTLTHKRKSSVSKRRWHHWRRMSAAGIEYGMDPDAPMWWPGRPFGSHERGWHVREAQLLLGIKPTGVYNRDTVARVKGYQRMRPGLMPTGILDLPTARQLDPGPYDH